MTRTVHSYGSGDVVIEQVDDLPLLRTTFNHYDHTPSWKRRTEVKEGSARLDIRGHQAAGWVTIDLGEWGTLHNTVRTGKDTSITLPRDQVAVLREMLNRVLDGDDSEDCNGE